LKVEPLLEDRLVFVTTHAGDGPEPGDGYVYVDWGPEFYARHNAMFPDFAAPAITVNIGWLGLQHIVVNGGSGFFPYRLIHEFVESGRLTIPSGSAEFVLPAYVVYPVDGIPDLLPQILRSMHRLVAGFENHGLGKPAA
jgi:LysR family transcriptional regulator, flagellar master operon regulator